MSYYVTYRIKKAEYFVWRPETAGESKYENRQTICEIRVSLLYTLELRVISHL